MENLTLSQCEKIQKEAETWFAKMQNERVDSGVKKAFDDWFNASSQHQQAYHSVNELFADFDLLDDLIQQNSASLLGGTVQPCSAQTLHTLKDRFMCALNAFLQGVPQYKFIYGGALSVCVIALCLMLFDNTISSSQYQTAVGEWEHVALEDGSRVDLNTKTNIKVSLSEQSRDILLLAGEMHIGVSPDKQRPMTIDTGEILIKVVGTEFNVFKQADSVAVSVVEGIVDIGMAGETSQDTDWLRLRANQRVTYTEGTGFGPIITVDPYLSSWKDGYLIYDASDLQTVISDINRYSSQRIVIAEPSLEQMEVSGIIQLDSMDSIANTLEKLFPIEVIENNQGEILLYQSK